VLAVSVLAAERVLDELDGRPAGTLEEGSQKALARAPHAAAWARRFARPVPVRVRSFRREAAPAAVVYAVDGIAHAAVPDPDLLLTELLADAIADIRLLLGRQPLREPVGGNQPARPSSAGTSALPSSAPIQAPVAATAIASTPVESPERSSA
jgi:hypothetical protein